jgi:hypothetical protein
MYITKNIMAYQKIEEGKNEVYRHNKNRTGRRMACRDLP